MAWYEDYFDEYYNLLEEPKQKETLSHFTFIQSFLSQIPPKGKVLDLACGSGRLSLIMSRLKFEVTALDLKEDLFHQAEQKAIQEGLKINFMQGDMRDIPFEQKFDFVLNFNHSFGYFSDERDNFKTLKEIYKCLKSGGKLLMDLSNFTSLIRDFEKLNRIWSNHDQQFVLLHRTFDPLTGRLDTKIKIINEKLKEFPENYVTSVRYYSYPELKYMLLDAGFKIEQVFGNYDGKPYVMESPRMIIYAEK
jgi:2-polyprenyl-3-methyl-5-hydroxy-6-metoxy-1,4-benzoquinol methylase